MRFYNPGTVISDKLAYTHPLKDPKEMNTTSYFGLSAEEKGFFEVPSTLTLQTEEGETTVAVSFPKRVKQLYQDRGVVMIDARLEEEGAPKIAEDDNLAANDKDAKAKGNAMWKDYLKAIVAGHYTTVAEIKQGGGVPRAAKGLVKYALNALHMEDPADQVDTITRAKEGQASNAEILAEMQLLRDQLNQMKGMQSAGKRE